MSSGKKASEPKPSRPRIPEYGIPKTPNGMLPWSFVDERMASAKNYWVSTTRPDGRPHTRPVDGVWLHGVLSFGGSPRVKWVQNLEANPHVSVHLDSGDEVVILEGKAERVLDPDHPLATPVLEASKKKYPQYYPGSGTPPFRPFWIFRPGIAFAWTLSGFPKSATLFRLKA
ncbi:MAG TPA: pyridoxamine 5'-phosphate oxidase family protein [Vicinamibacteria bacterium]|nr:pyridoxamine 5'-phosphate oxidase family protein [Vicinamibacteria bacterium]